VAQAGGHARREQVDGQLPEVDRVLGRVPGQPFGAVGVTRRVGAPGRHLCWAATAAACVSARCWRRPVVPPSATVPSGWRVVLVARNVVVKRLSTAGGPHPLLSTFAGDTGSAAPAPET
jgi:hypothetical protein